MRLIETIDYLFEELFTIRFSHAGLQLPPLSMLSEHITICPDADTEKLFRDYNINTTFSNDTFVCYTRCRLLVPPAPNPRAAYIIPPNNIVFRFLLKASQSFMAKTNIDPVAKGEAYYFSNRANAGTGMFISKNATGVDDPDKVNLPDTDTSESLGVIDVFSSGAVNNNYELFTGAAGQLLSPQYRLNFISSI